MSALLLLLVHVVLVGIWINALVTYDWSKWEEDSKNDTGF